MYICIYVDEQISAINSDVNNRKEKRNKTKQNKTRPDGNKVNPTRPANDQLTVSGYPL